MKIKNREREVFKMVKDSKEDVAYSKVRRHMEYVYGSLSKDRQELFTVNKDLWNLNKCLALKEQNINQEIITLAKEAEQKIWEAIVAVGQVLGNQKYLGYENIEEEEKN